MIELGILLSLVDTASQPLRMLGSTLEQTATRSGNAFQRLGQTLDRISGRLTAMGAVSATLGHEIMHLAEKPVHAFIEMDTAMNDLAVATLDHTGRIGAGFDQLREKVLSIDNRLPMTTAQVAEIGTALKDSGVTMQQMLSGAYDAAANLAVVLKLPGEEAGTMVARLREAHGLAGNQLNAMADLMQRARFAFGISPVELKYASAYAAPNINMLGLTGLDNAKKLLALQGMGAAWNFQGSSFGTNFSMFLQRLSKGPEMVEMATKGMKGKAREAMEKAHVHFDFYDGKGKLKGIDDMVAQLQDAYRKLTAVGKDKMALDVFSTVFGAEAGRVAQMLAVKGTAGYQDAQKRIDDQASLDQRIQQTMQSAQNIWTVFSTNVTNALAAFAEPAVKWLEPMIMRMGDAVAQTRHWVEQHQTFAKWTMVVVGGLGVMLTTFGSIALTAGLFAKVLAGPLGMIGFLIQRVPFAAAFRALGDSLGFLARGLPVVLTGLRALGLALLGIPGIGLIAAGVTLVAFLVWKYWSPIKAFLGGMWDGLVKGFAPVGAVLGPAFSQLGHSLMSLLTALKPVGIALAGMMLPLMPLLGPAIDMLKGAWQWVVALLRPVDATGNAARNMGLRVGEAIAGALGWFAKLYASMLSLPTRFFQLGADLVNGLVSGITGRLAAAQATIVGFGNNIKGWFAHTLGIHSPSRVFIGFGENIGMGAEIGILNRLSGVRGATGQMAAAATGMMAAKLRALDTVDRHLATGRLGGADAAGGASSPVIHFSPTIHVSGGADAGNQVHSAMQTSYTEFERMMNRYFANRRRTAF
ncbi:phage tail tape measure protein [Paraburkholderia sp. BR14263]|uniref:phage tail tape measure protein n=1 Tax=unclassified Paraburkholderia TaxID=2615204 RepID=UPI0034CF3B0C